MIAEALFKAAFDVLDKLPVEQRDSLARRVYEAAYGWSLAAAKDDDGASKTGSPGAENAPSNTSVLKSSRPRPPQ